MLNGNRLVDTFLFHNELDVLEIRLEELSAVADRFVLAEAPVTHSGKPKPLHFEENKGRFSKFLDRITHLVVDDFPEADFSKPGESWKYERHQRDSLARALVDLADRDIVIHSDVDEVPRADALRSFRPESGFMGLDQSMHTYWLNCVTREMPYGWCKIFAYGATRALGPLWTMCQIRYLITRSIPAGGWHFSFMGGVREVVEKIEAWAHQEYNVEGVKNERRIRELMEAGIDPHGRPMRYKLEPLDHTYPRHVLTNPERFRRLLKEPEAPRRQDGEPRTLEWNKRVWEKYAWTKDGDEWSEMAQYSGVPYERWKETLALTFLIPHLGPRKAVCEIGAGRGRWSVMIAPRVRDGRLDLIDLCPGSADFLRKRFSGEPHVRVSANDGRTLPMVETRSVDFIWSFDTFVHVEEPEAQSYAREFARILRPTGMGVIHHPGSPSDAQRQNGCRSRMTALAWRQLLAKHGLYVIRQADSWEGGNVKLNADTITVFVRP